MLHWRVEAQAAEGWYFAVCLFVHTKHSQKAGPFSVARLELDVRFHDRLAFTGEVPALLARLLLPGTLKQSRRLIASYAVLDRHSAKRENGGGKEDEEE